MAKSFNIFRFPTHIFFWKYIIDSGAPLFFFGLIINTFFYAVIVEAVTGTIINRTIVKKSGRVIVSI